MKCNGDSIRGRTHSLRMQHRVVMGKMQKLSVNSSGSRVAQLGFLAVFFSEISVCGSVRLEVSPLVGFCTC